MASLNAALKALGHRNGPDYRIEDRAGIQTLSWLADPARRPTDQQIEAARAALDARAYRWRRKAAYIARLGEDGTFENTVGDVLDALIRQVELNRIAAGAEADPEFAAKVAEIADIKAEFPKG